MKDLIVGNSAVTDIVEAVKTLPVLKPEHVNFLVEHKQHLACVLEKTHIWRTDIQRKSILSDNYHPTIHSKFHQAILEQKVQFENTMYLAKDFELKKLEIEELECDIEELTDTKRDQIKRKKAEIEIQFKQFELKQMKIAMNYRMEEIKGWQIIENELIAIMRDNGFSEEDIWNKNSSEVISMFLSSMTSLQGIKNTTDGAERNNLIALAKFSYDQVKVIGALEDLRSKCSAEQQESIKFIEELYKINQ